jgi:Fis family transcriptional regulator
MKQEQELERCVRQAIDSYFADLGHGKPHPLYDMVMARVERPLIESALARVAGNQTRAAELLGMNRNTLRKKMQALRIGSQ